MSYGPYAMSPSEDRVDFKASGRLYRIKFSGDSAPSHALIGKPIFDAELRGRR